MRSSATTTRASAITNRKRSRKRWFLLLLLEYAETYVWPTVIVSTITRLWLLSVPLTVGIVVLAALAWKDRYWGVAGRVHYTLVALAAVVFVLFLNNWNLIGL